MTANYTISAVWFKANQKGSEYISHVMLHAMNGDTINTGIKTSKEDVVTLLKMKTIRTIKWDYKTGGWSWGAQVTTETRNGIHYLRTVPDRDISNNLDNLINMSIIHI